MDTSDIFTDSGSEMCYGYDYEGDEDAVEEVSEDGDYLDDAVVVVQRREAPWDIITPLNIQQHQTEMLAEVAEVLACTPSVARLLLVQNNWDKTQLINDYVEKGRDIVFHQAGCSWTADPPTQSPEGQTCACCFGSVEELDATAMMCGHWFCNDCWVGHFEVQIREGNSCRLRCMAYKCNQSCDEEMVLKLLEGRPRLRERYQNTLLESYVNDNSTVKWCPSIPNCGNAVRNNRDECCEPVCHCALQFCFECLAEAHSPCTCEMWTAWERKRMDDSETVNWITAHTKPCPKCGKVVEKNGGCNLMTCRCGQHFCWLCGQATGFAHTYATINGHECGRWKAELDKSIDTADFHHKRYMHYFTRWNGHRDSLKKELASKDQTLIILKGWCDSLQGHVVEHSSLMGAISVLTSARRVLSNSYAFAFFLTGKDWYTNEIHPDQISLNQALFEDMQQQFEAEVERLSELLSVNNAQKEQRNDTEKRARLQDTINCARTCLKRMQNFYDAINSGLLGQLEQSVVSISDFMPYHIHV